MREKNIKKETIKETIKVFRKFINLIELNKEPSKITISKNGIESIECEYNPNSRKWKYKEKIENKIIEETEIEKIELIKKIKNKYYKTKQKNGI